MNQNLKNQTPEFDLELTMALADYHRYCSEIISQIKDIDVWYESVEHRKWNPDWYRVIRKKA